MSSRPAAPPPSGQLVDVGGYRLQLACLGDGGPTVVMEAAIGETGLLWSLVQPAVAQLAPACVYDRAGLGWSDPSPEPRTAAAMVDELHTLLSTAQVPSPMCWSVSVDAAGLSWLPSPTRDPGDHHLALDVMVATCPTGGIVAARSAAAAHHEPG
jgi:hypothetical protein